MNNNPASSIISMISYILLAPIMTVILSILGVLAVITSILTSSFVSIRLILLAIEFGLGITLASASQFISWFKSRLHQLVRRGNNNNNRNDIITTHHEEQKVPIIQLNHLVMKPNFIGMPPKTSVKKMYSKSVPNTPDPIRHTTPSTPFPF
ncbi:hypothetical protein BDA99DRAFT_605779 [Phascolomyces articulosus]|uniref:Uncharacterized protein n=1 Tax=Phascolomyces articulosus TaxID=60185 RepID=A0AAD5K759_9FUNG|nr:hypothetical protein BDA99DRAFT_605779 [Phascolomyces articulosus]